VSHPNEIREIDAFKGVTIVKGDAAKYEDCSSTHAKQRHSRELATVVYIQEV